MVLWCGLGVLCGKVHPAAQELTKQEVADLFALSTRLNGGRLIVHGLFARADTLNTNGRIYPKAIMRREVSHYQHHHIRQGTALGELNHPSYYSSYFKSLNLPNVSHQVLGVWWRGRELWGVIEVLPTPAGLLLWELYSKGVKLGVSSRGWASVVVDSATQQAFVDKDFQLITFDFVTEPSNVGAFLVPLGCKYRRPIPDQSRIVRVSYLGIGSSHMTQLTQIPGAATLSSWLKQTSKTMTATQHCALPRQHQQQQSSGRDLLTPPITTLLPPPDAAVAVACSAHLNGEDTSATASSMHDTKCTTSGSAADAAEGSSFIATLGPCSQSGVCPSLPPHTSLGGGVVLGCHYQVLTEPWLPVDPSGREFKNHLSLVATKAHLLQQRQDQRRHPQQQCNLPVAQQQVQQDAHQLQQLQEQQLSDRQTVSQSNAAVRQTLQSSTGAPCPTQQTDKLAAAVMQQLSPVQQAVPQVVKDHGAQACMQQALHQAPAQVILHQQV